MSDSVIYSYASAVAFTMERLFDVPPWHRQHLLPGGAPHLRYASAIEPSLFERISMIKVSVLYPNRPDAQFNHAYYRDSHMPLVQHLLGDACVSYTIDMGVAGMQTDGRPPYVAMCHILSQSLADFTAALGPHAAELEADLANFTNLTAVMQISEEVVLSTTPAKN